MTAHIHTTRALALAGLGAFLALAIALLAADPSSGRQAERASAIKIGKTKSSPKATCPSPKPKPVGSVSGDSDRDGIRDSKECQAMGRVTGFQVSADGRRGPFKIRQHGHIVAWGLALGRPTKGDQEFFATELANSGPPDARISILKARKGGMYKLVKQSPIVPLKPELGTRPVFTLADPLKVRKGQIVAITARTWAPNLADFGARGSDEWKASRDPGRCDGEANLLKKSRPQQKVGGKRAYACKYRGARLMYWAYLAPSGR